MIKYINTSTEISPQNCSCKHLAMNQPENTYICFPRRTGRLFFFSISLNGALSTPAAPSLPRWSAHGSCPGLGLNWKCSRKCGTWGFAEEGRKENVLTLLTSSFSKKILLNVKKNLEFQKEKSLLNTFNCILLLPHFSLSFLLFVLR